MLARSDDDVFAAALATGLFTALDVDHDLGGHVADALVVDVIEDLHLGSTEGGYRPNILLNV